jgi:hypothetical protein
MEPFHWIAHGVFLADLVIRVGLTVRVIKRRLPVGVSLAWLMVLLVIPLDGAVIYLVMGESRLGIRRARRAAAYRESRGPRTSQKRQSGRLDGADLDPGGAALARLAEATLGAVVLPGNRLEDWTLETGEAIAPGLPAAPAESGGGRAALQVLPTGPGARVEAIEEVVLAAIYAAKGEVVLTTPYFVPSEPLLLALLSAAARGVSVTLIVPAKVDSRLVQIVNDAAMQALGNYKGGKMLFLGLGTGLGSAMVLDGIVEPMELVHLPYKKRAFEDYVSIRGLDRLGKKKWCHYEAVPVPVLTTAIYERFASRGEADYQDKLLSAMRFGFGGHLEKAAAK